MANIIELYPELNFYDNYKNYFDKRTAELREGEELTFTCEERKEYDKTIKPAKD